MKFLSKFNNIHSRKEFEKTEYLYTIALSQIEGKMLHHCLCYSYQTKHALQTRGYVLAETYLPAVPWVAMIELTRGNPGPCSWIY